MRGNILLKLTLLTLTMTLGAWGATLGVLEFGPGANTGLLCPDLVTDAALGCGLSPNPTAVNQLSVYLNYNVGSDLEMFRLIIGVPQAAPDALPAMPYIDRVDIYNPYSGGLDSSNGTNRSGVFCGYLTAGETSAYAECGAAFIPSANNSFANWLAAAQDLGLNPAKFALFVYDLDSVEDLNDYGLYDVFFSGSLVPGTMEIAYGCSTNDCTWDCYKTYFENAGQVPGGEIPEPATWMMMAGAGLALLGRRYWMSRG